MPPSFYYYSADSNRTGSSRNGRSAGAAPQSAGRSAEPAGPLAARSSKGGSHKAAIWRSKREPEEASGQVRGGFEAASRRPATQKTAKRPNDPPAGQKTGNRPAATGNQQLNIVNQDIAPEAPRRDKRPRKRFIQKSQYFFTKYLHRIKIRLIFALAIKERRRSLIE